MSDPNKVDICEPAGCQKQDRTSPEQSGFIHSISTFHYGRQDVSSIPVLSEILKKPIKQEQNISRLGNHHDGRINIPYCEINIVHGCNLRCAQCSHFSPYRKGLSTKEDIVDWLHSWSQKIDTNVINLLGGEPFLHPDLAEIVRECNHILPDSKIEITTNGLLLPRIDVAIFDVLREANVKIIVSDHSGNGVPYGQVLEGIGLLKKQNVQHVVRNSNNQWYVPYRWNEKNAPIPFQSNPKLAWSVCYAKNCKSLMNNKFYKCSILANIAKSVEEGVLAPNLWQAALTYKPLTLDSTAEEIAAHFNTREIPECRNCPDQLILVRNEQLSVSDVKVGESIRHDDPL